MRKNEIKPKRMSYLIMGGKFDYRYQSEETKRQALKEIAGMNMTQLLTQVMINGLIDKYVYLICDEIKEQNLNVKKKGGNPFKFLYHQINTINSELKRKTKTIMEHTLKPCIMVTFPCYWDRYVSEGDLAHRFQYAFKCRYKDLIAELETLLHETFMTDGVDNNVFPYVMVLATLANLACRLIEETFDIMIAKGEANGINVTKQTSGIFASLRGVCSKFIAQTTNGRIYNTDKKEIAKEKCEEFQCTLISNESIGLINDCVEELVNEYVDYCVACMIIDIKNGMEITEETKTHCQKMIGDIPIKKLIQNLKQLGKVLDKDEPLDLVDELKKHKYKIVELLKKKSKEY